MPMFMCYWRVMTGAVGGLWDYYDDLDNMKLSKSKIFE